jgi:hypothetical protein
MPNYFGKWWGAAEGEELENASSAISFSQSATCTTERPRSASSSLSLTQEADEFYYAGDADSTISFSQAATYQRIVTRTPSNNISFTQDLARIRVIDLSLEHTLGLGHSIIPGTELSVDLENDLNIQNALNPLVQGDLENDLELLNDLSRGDSHTNDLGLGVTVSAVASKGLRDELDLDNSVTPSMEYGRSTAQDLGLGNIIAAIIETACNLHEYSPYGLPAAPSLSKASEITLVYGLTTLTLRNPDFGDSVEADPKKAMNISRSGTVNMVRQSFWSSKTNIQFTVTFCDPDLKEEILSFYEESLGQLVTYTDPEGREWEGILMTPSDPVIQTKRNEYQASFNFRGAPV